MFKIQIKTEDYQPILLVVGDWSSIWSVYRLFSTSVQNMNDSFLVNVTDLHSNLYIDITKGRHHPISIKEQKDEWLIVNKETGYIKSIVHGKLIQEDD